METGRIYRCVVTMFVLASIFPSSLAQVSGNSTSMDTSAYSNLTSSTPDLQGIWSLILKEQQATMVVHQYDTMLFGSAKRDVEPPWNAVLLGSANGENIQLKAVYMQGGKEFSITLLGTVEDGSITGSFFQSAPQGQVDRGAFSAMLINPDTSQYRPADVLEDEGPAAKDVPDQGSVTVSQVKTEEETAPSPRSGRFTDVHDLAHLVPEAAGVIPPGIPMFGL